MNDNSPSPAKPRRRRVRRIEPRAELRSAHGEEVMHLWRVTYRSPSWAENQGPVTKLFDSRRHLATKLRSLRTPTANRPAADILQVERVRISGEWEEVSL